MSSLLFAAKLTSKIATGLFSGSVFYCSVAEHPGRMAAGTRAASTVFPSSFKRAASVQVGLALANTFASAYVYTQEKDKKWLAVSLLTLSILPYTWITLMPINCQLLDEKLDKDSENTHNLLTTYV
jgi:hypothetical protein